MSTQLVLTPINGEPRVHDLELANRLGFERPVNVRNLIKRNSQKLEAFGPLFTVKRVINGGEATEFYLNQKQSIFICMKSETERAFEVQAEIVRVFDAYLKGELTPQHPIMPARARMTGGSSTVTREGSGSGYVLPKSTPRLIKPPETLP